MTDFSKMTSEEQQALVKKVGDVLNDCGLGDVSVEMVTEQVCNLSAKNVELTTTLLVKKDLPSTQSELADRFNTAVKPIIEGIENCNVKVVSKLGAGDNYKTIGNVMAIKGDEETSIEHKEGEVWLLDFWATWCPPCQKPMAHNQDMITRRKADWGSNVRIIGLSIDQTKEAVVKHCETKGWMDVEHYHRHKSDCSQVYSVSGVPHVMLIDTKGKIAFKGHPASRPDLEKDIDALLKGETLEGEGCGPAKADDNAEAMPEGFKKLDMDAVAKEIEGFQGVFEGFTKDEEMGELAKGFMRAFCVIVLQNHYTPKTGEFVGKYQNYRVLVGPKDNLEKIKTKLDESVKGSFEVVLREQGI